MLSTVHLFEFCKLYNNMDVPFDLTAIRTSIEDEENFEDFVDLFLDPIFGKRWNLTYEVWSKKLEMKKRLTSYSMQKNSVKLSSK